MAPPFYWTVYFTSSTNLKREQSLLALMVKQLENGLREPQQTEKAKADLEQLLRHALKEGSDDLTNALVFARGLKSELPALVRRVCLEPVSNPVWEPGGATGTHEIALLMLLSAEGLKGSSSEIWRERLLLQLVTAGWTEGVQHLLAQKEAPPLSAQEGNLALQAALMRGNDGIARLLLKHGIAGEWDVALNEAMGRKDDLLDAVLDAMGTHTAEGSWRMPSQKGFRVALTLAGSPRDLATIQARGVVLCEVDPWYPHQTEMAREHTFVAQPPRSILEAAVATNRFELALHLVRTEPETVARLPELPHILALLQAPPQRRHGREPELNQHRELLDALSSLHAALPEPPSSKRPRRP